MSKGKRITPKRMAAIIVRSALVAAVRSDSHIWATAEAYGYNLEPNIAEVNRHIEKLTRPLMDRLDRITKGVEPEPAVTRWRGNTYKAMLEDWGNGPNRHLVRILPANAHSSTPWESGTLVYRGDNLGEAMATVRRFIPHARYPHREGDRQ